MRYLLILFLLLPCISWGAVTAYVASDPCSTTLEGTWTQEDSVCVDGSGDAIVTADDDTIWIYNFDLAVPTDSTVDSLRIRLEAHSTVVDKDNACRFKTSVSKDNGQTWCSGSELTIMTTSEAPYALTDADWGCSGGLDSASCDSIAVRICTDVFLSTGSNEGHIDYVAVCAYYSFAPSGTSQKGLNVDDKLGAGKGMID